MSFRFILPSEKPKEFRSKLNDLRIISEKIKIPQVLNGFTRPRLTELIHKQIELFGTSLVSGRAGTGKSTLAVEISGGYQRKAWFRVEATDMDWEIFSQYFFSSFQETIPNFHLDQLRESDADDTETKVLRFLEHLFNELEKVSTNSPVLIILDDLHSVFDAEWFGTFFNGLLSYNIPNVHILLLTRSIPPFPLWRMRSKQKLGVVDEDLLLLTVSELEEIMATTGISEKQIRRIHKKSYGRISKVLELVGRQTL